MRPFLMMMIGVLFSQGVIQFSFGIAHRSPWQVGLGAFFLAATVASVVVAYRIFWKEPRP